MIFCTSIAANYLPKAMVLAKSLKMHNPTSKMIICLVEREIPEFARNFEYFDEIVLAKELGINNFDKFIFKYNVVEASTAVKGQLFKYLLNKFKEHKKFVYLDPDIKVFGKFDLLYELLDKHEIVLTPHLYEPENNTNVENVFRNEVSCLRHGIFNLGFLGIRRGEESEKFIDWWASRLEMFCYEHYPSGVFTDQKWIDLAPVFFKTYILKHPGYNFAIWNYSTRKLEYKDGEYLVNGEKLIFIHLSGYDSGLNERITKLYYTSDSPIYRLLEEYKNELNQNSSFVNIKEWSYDYFFSGEKVLDETRKYYRSHPQLNRLFENPYLESNRSIAPQGDFDSAEWQKVKTEILKQGLGKEHLLDMVKDNLIFLKNKFNNKTVRCLIWGASNGGLIVKKIVQCLLPNFKVIGFIDKYKNGFFEGKKIYNPKNFLGVDFDVILIATTPGKEEAMNYLEAKKFKEFNDYFCVLENHAIKML